MLIISVFCWYNSLAKAATQQHLTVSAVVYACALVETSGLQKAPIHPEVQMHTGGGKVKAWQNVRERDMDQYSIL